MLKTIDFINSCKAFVISSILSFLLPQPKPIPQPFLIKTFYQHLQLKESKLLLFRWENN